MFLSLLKQYYCLIKYNHYQPSIVLIPFPCAIAYTPLCPKTGTLARSYFNKNKTQAGIRAVINEEVSPVVIYITRDHHYNNKYFGSVEEGDEITAKVIGQRYELNDEQVSGHIRYILQTEQITFPIA